MSVHDNEIQITAICSNKIDDKTFLLCQLQHISDTKDNSE